MTTENDKLITAVAGALRDHDLLSHRSGQRWADYIDKAATVLALVRSWDASQNVVRVTMTTLDNFGNEIAMLRQQLNEAINRITR